VYIQFAAPSKLRFPRAPSPNITASHDPAVIERGRQLVYGVAHCATCHADYPKDHPERLHGDVPLAGGITISPPFGDFRPSNITSDRATGIGAWSDEEIARVIRTGVRRNGELSVFMRLAVAPESDEDLTAIVSYLRTVAPVRKRIAESQPNFMAKALVVLVGFEPRSIEELPGPPPADAPSVDRGRYLVKGPGACEGCHSAADITAGFELVRGRELGGGDPFGDELNPAMEYCPPNLTKNREHGFVGSVNEDDFVARFRRGRSYRSSPMPWECFKRMTDPDLRSVYRYLASAPPVRNDPGPSFREAGWSPPD